MKKHQSPYTYYLWFFPLLFGVLLLESCTNNRYRDFNPEEIVNVPEAQLTIYADTTSTLPRLEAYHSDRKKVDSLLYYAEALRNNRKDIAQLYAQKAYDIATEKNWYYPRAISAYRLAILKESAAKYNEDIEDAMVDANISKRIFDQTNEESWKVRIYALIGTLHFRKNDIKSAQTYLHRALKMVNSESLSSPDNTALKGEIHHHLALTFKLTDAQKTIFHFEQSDSLYKSLGSLADRSRLWIGLSKFYIERGKYVEADSLIKLALNYGKQSNDTDILITSYQTKGYLSAIKYYYYKKEQQSREALKDFKKCLELQQEGRYRTYDLMAWVYFSRWSYIDHEPDIDSTLVYYKLSIEEARKEGALNAMKSAAEAVAYLCSLENKRSKCNQILDTTATVFLNQNFSGVVDTITRHSKAAYQRTNKVEQREIVVSADRQQQNILLSAGGIFVIAGLTFLLILQQFRQKRLQARMEALRAQINPHFFSNSLNAIESLINLDKKKEASKYIIHFSRLSRQILNRSRDPNISLKEELKMMKHFLELEKLRFRDKLNYEIKVASDLDTALIEVPGMILQPYAENAILHGIKPKSEPGNLLIEVKKEGKKLICIVEDDGIGQKKSKAMRVTLSEQRKSMGMAITKERIQSMGKVKGQHLEIIDLIDEQGEALGTRVILQLPLKYRKEKTIRPQKIL